MKIVDGKLYIGKGFVKYADECWESTKCFVVIGGWIIAAVVALFLGYVLLSLIF